MYGGSAGLQTTVNMGVRLLKPMNCISAKSLSESKVLLTANREFWAASDELEELSTLFWSILAHGGEQVADALTVQVVTVISLDRVHESCSLVSSVFEQ